MTLSRTNTVLAVLLVVVVIMTSLSGVDYSKPNIEVLPDMKYTPAWTSFAANPNFPNGRTLQAPVAGTIARGELPLYFEATKEDAIRAGEELVNPYDLSEFEADVAREEEDADEPEAATDRSSTTDESDHTSHAEGPAAAEEPDNAAGQNELSEEAQREAAARERLRASVQRGGDVFRTFCISCHGANGMGDGPVTQHGFPPPPSMLTGKSLQMKDGQLFHVLTYGQGSMMPFAAQLSRSQRWDAINYVRDLQRKAPPAAVMPPTESDATPTAGADEVEVKATPEEGEGRAKAVSEPEPDELEKSVDKKEADSEEETDAIPETEIRKAPQNKLRDREADDTTPARDFRPRRDQTGAQQ